MMLENARWIQLGALASHREGKFTTTTIVPPDSLNAGLWYERDLAS